MAELSELVEDFKLNTQFRDGYVYHTYDECDPSSGQRVVRHRELWRRGKHLGSGGFGSVWLEECIEGRRKGQPRAVKVIRCPRGRVDYTRELESLARFSKGSCARWFCQSLGWYESEDDVHLTMEYCPLGDLQSYLIQSGEPLTEVDVQEITLQVVEGLDFMHKKNFAHRDIKPGNILIQSQPPNNCWWIKISDFGLSKRLRDSLGVSSSVIGTVAFMSPEQQGFAPTGKPSQDKCPKAGDVWATGIMSHLLLTKKHLFTIPFELFEYVSRPEAYLAHRFQQNRISLPASNFIEWTLAVDPNKRMTADQALRNPWLVRSVEEVASALNTMVLEPNEKQGGDANLETSEQDRIMHPSVPTTVTEEIEMGAPQDRTIRPVLQSSHPLVTVDTSMSGGGSAISDKIGHQESQAYPERLDHQQSSNAEELRMSTLNKRLAQNQDRYMPSIPVDEALWIHDTEKMKSEGLGDTANVPETMNANPEHSAQDTQRNQSIRSDQESEANLHPGALDLSLEQETTLVVERDCRAIWKFGRTTNGSPRAVRIPVFNNVFSTSFSQVAEYRNQFWTFFVLATQTLEPHVHEQWYLAEKNTGPITALSPGANLFSFVTAPKVAINGGVGSLTTEIVIIKMTTGKALSIIEVRKDLSSIPNHNWFERLPYTSLALSPDGTLVATSDWYKIMTWEVLTKRCAKTLQIAPIGPCVCMVISSGNWTLAAICYARKEYTLAVWDIADHRRVFLKLPGLNRPESAQEPMSVAFLLDKSIVIGFRPRGGQYCIIDKGASYSNVREMLVDSLEHKSREVLTITTLSMLTEKGGVFLEHLRSAYVPFAIRIPLECYGDNFEHA